MLLRATIPPMPDATDDPAAATPGAHRWAAVDVGSHSVHLLVADVVDAVDGRIEPVVDESIVLGLGERADDARLLGERAGDLLAALGSYVARARSMGARGVALVGTEPLRRAADAATVVASVAMATGIALHVLDHDEEGLLMFIGATGGRSHPGGLAVVDIGGGSTEVVMGGPAGPSWALGLPIGGARLTRLVEPHDPPLPAELARLRAAARGAFEALPDASPAELIAVGGTASNLVKVVQAAHRDGLLTTRRLQVAMRTLAREAAATEAARFVISPARARILPAGAAILEAMMARYGLRAARVIEGGVREGLVLAQDRAGDSWRDRLRELARGWEA